jgi:type VI secretion system protein ImpI
VARGFVLQLYGTDNAPLGSHPFRALPIRIGRNALNDCQVVQNFVSDFHARLEDLDGRVSIRDLNSKNGIYVRPTPSGSPTRITANVPIDLAPHGFEFFVGPFLRIEVHIVDTDSAALERDPKSVGTVLGNRQMLRDGLPPSPSSPPGAQRSVPPVTGPGNPYHPSGSPLPSMPGIAPLPPLDGSRGAVSGSPSDAPLAYGAGSRGAPEFAPNPHAARMGEAHPAPAGAGDMRRTGHFGMSQEVLAFQGLRELAGSLLPGQPLETTGDIARLITKLHDAIEVFCRSFIPLRDGYAQFVSSMDLQRAALQRSVNRSRSYLAVEMARDPGAVAAALLDWRDPSLDAPKAIEGIFADLMLHQVALLDGVMQGVRALLDELSPENIEQMVEEREPRSPLGLHLGGRHKALWEAFCERHEQLSEEKQAFGHIFGPEFTEAYRQYRRRRSNEPGSR